LESRDTNSVLRAGWFLPVIGLLFGGTAGAVMALLTTPTYTSTTQLFVTTTDSASTAAAFQGSQFSQDRVASYVEVLTSERLADRVVSALGVDLSPEELQQKIDATVVPDTTVLDIKVTDSSPRLARDLTATIATEFTSLVEEVEASTVRPPDPAQPPITTVPVKVTVLEVPEVPGAPTSPNPVSNVATGILIGLVLGFVWAYARVRLDRSVWDPKVATALAGAPVIGVIPRDPQLAREHVLENHSWSATAEGYRKLRTSLQFLDIEEPPRVIMVSSPTASEGKTTLAVNLAVSLAEVGHRVTVVEADLRRPRVAEFLDLQNGAGLTTVLSGALDLEDVLQSPGYGALSVLSAGPIPPNPSELLASSRLRALMDVLRTSNDFVIVDSPPLLPVSDGSAVAVAVDGVLLCVRYGRTQQEELEQAAAILGGVGARTLGVILNGVPATRDELSATYGHDTEAPAGRHSGR
jgi:capsular exopolysaccharide synthesis family protein